MNFSIIPTDGIAASARSRCKQIFRVMKLTTLMLFLALMQVSAKVSSQITLNLKNAPLTEVVTAIENQSGFVFLYNNNQLKNQKVNIKVSNASIKEVLDACFLNSNITYKIVDKTITVAAANTPLGKLQPLAAQELIDVSGRITDTLGKPLPGVSVRAEVNNAPTFSTSNTNGEYHIKGVPKNGVILFSMMGFTTQRISIVGRTVLNVVLKEAVMGLNEVQINTGIFTRKANSYTGSTLVIKGEDLKRVGNANLFQSLKNIAPSMVLDNFNMGSNPNAIPDIQLRGTSTFPMGSDAAGLKGNYEKSPNQPLFILDGFEASIERILDLDMNRIQSVTILRDAASKAIYGSKAANGVIVIETIKLLSSKPVVTYNSSLDLEMPDLTSYNLSNAMEKLEAERIDGFYLPSGKDPIALATRQQLYNTRRKLAMEGLDTYWLAKPLQNGVGQKHSVAVELGGQGLNILADVSYRDVQGAMIGSNRKNVSGSLMTSYRMNNLLFRNIMSANKNSTLESPYGTFSDYAKMNPYWRAVNLDGSIPFYAEVSADGTRYVNPLFNSTINSHVGTSYFNFTNNFYLEWMMLPGLKATTRVGIDVKNSDADEFYPASHTMFDTYISDIDLQRKGSYQVNNGKSQTLSGDLNVNYSKELNDHVFFANVGLNISEYSFNEIINRAEGFSSDRMNTILFARAYQLDGKPTGASAITRELGFLGAFSYMYDNRFLSDLTLRTNASSQFGKDKRWANFWSLGLGWNLHNESFMEGLDAVKQFKLRGSLGSTGNSNFLANQAEATYNYYVESLYQGFPGSYLANLSNSSLQWESKFDYNLGFDASIKNLNLKFDYYQSFTENLITDVSLPNSTGFNMVKDNLGKVKNTGFEVYGSYLLYSNKNDFFSLHFGVETNKNKIVELSNAMKVFNANMDKRAADQGNSIPVKKYMNGMSMNAIWAVPSLGIDPSTGNEIYLTKAGSTTSVWNANDMIVAGNSLPDYQGTVGFSSEYKGIGLSITARYLGGGQLYNQTLVDRVENVDMNYNVDKRVLTGRWTAPGQQALFKRLGTYAVTQADGSTISFDEKTRATTRFIQDRNELSISAVNLYYQFNKNMIDKLGLSRLKAGVNMNELYTFSSIEIERGTSYPFARTLSFNLSATF